MQTSNPSPVEVEANRQLVLAFYQQCLVDRQPREAFERYVSPNLVEHKPDVPGGTREAVIDYLEDLMASLPSSRWELFRTIAEGDMVFLHARFTPSPGAPAYAIADVFRVSEGLIQEHWDVIGPPPDAQLNPNSRF